jgi:DnaJ-class molecular chaperone
MKTAYDTLGIAQNATQEAIKAAFHKLAHQHHPDKPGGNADRFKEASAAYNDINTPEKQRSYNLRMGIYNPQYGGYGSNGAAGPVGEWRHKAADNPYGKSIFEEVRKEMHNQERATEQDLFRRMMESMRNDGTQFKASFDWFGSTGTS